MIGLMARIVATDLRRRVSDVLELIRPSIQADGGDVELVSVEGDGVVTVRFRGACVSCPSRTLTLQGSIEHNLRERIPEVKSVQTIDR